MVKYLSFHNNSSLGFKYQGCLSIHIIYIILHICDENCIYFIMEIVLRLIDEINYLSKCDEKLHGRLFEVK
jgi:hypothetical protein